jgi:hypothetical protein
VTLATILALGLRVWPALAGTAGAVWFLSQHQYDQALTVFLGGLGLGHVLHASTAPPPVPPQPAPRVNISPPVLLRP